MITLRQIQFALAVAEHLHFKRAAEACFVSQSALSLGVAEFEKSLGVTVFERNNKQVIVTPVGKSLLARAERLYLDAQALMESAHASQKPLTTPMSIGFIPTIAPYFLPKILPALRTEFPQFSVNIHEDLSERLLHSLQSGALDAAVIALPYPTESFESIVFGAEQFYVVAQKNLALCNEKRIKPQQLLELPMMLLSDGHCLKDQIIEVCKFPKTLDKGSLREASLSTLIQMSLNGMGITLVPEMALETFDHQQQACAVPLDVPTPHRRLAIVYRPNYARQDELKMLGEIFSTVLK